MQGPYYHLTVTRDGKEVELFTKLPGVPDLPDPYLTLKPGDKVEFELTTFALQVQDLPPGRYQARVRVGTRPEKGKSDVYDSPPAEFTVEK